MIPRLTDETLFDARAILAEALLRTGSVTVEVVDPDTSARHFDGELFDLGGIRCRYRSWATWVELAHSLTAMLETPVSLGTGWVRLRMRALDQKASWHHEALPTGNPEKYGIDTAFARIDKFEEPAFLAAWTDAIDFLNVPDQARVLSLGCHTGAELAALHHQLISPKLLLGVDHSDSAIAAAKALHPATPFAFKTHDLATEGLPAGLFDLIIAINVLHSPALPGQALFRALVAEHLTPHGRVLIGWPNCRYIDHRLLWGAVTRHARGPELSVLISDVAHHRRYLHQHRFKTQVTGKNTVLLAGRRLHRSGEKP